MNFKDANALWLEISSACSFKKPKEEGLFEAILIPSSALYDASAEGCKLRFDTPILDESTRKCIKSIVEKHKLKMTESKESLIIYKP
jgi:hypothetical protein